ncbi:pentapeptide repeat-containing protein [Rothia mucilaginosa]|jgi:hypothetical protein|uniref:pentapeptide repeat-containing protein n=1 Tax=Rothia mucilaginosa TaxID=43675 RepID=UPI003A8994CF
MTKPIKDSKKPLQEPSWLSKYWFYTVLILLAVIGVPSAFFVPTLIPGLINDGNSIVSVRQGILAVLAGALTMLTLSETHRKNTYEKNKNERDHTRQVLAERRSRYAKAVEQLADEKASVRLGGIYTLAGLVDEWLADDALKLEEQQKEGQVIINNLCSYVRAPFPLAAKTEYLQSDVDIVPANYVGDFVADQVMFREEQDVRRTIFAEISNRSSTFTKDKNGNVFVTPGAWAEFDFDFSWAPIFYPLSNFTIEKAIFSSARFYGDANFIKTSFIQNVDFSRATFNGKAKFNGSEFAQEATFNEVVFNEVADFSDQGDVKTFFGGNVSFNYVRFAHDANFNGTTFAGNTNFSRAYFLGNAYFTNEAYVTKAAASFNTMEFSGVTFAGNASFRQATFASSANFREATFASSANFQEAAFKNEAVFMDTVFTCGVNFGRATFSSYANFNEATFKGGVRFAKTTFTNFEPSFAVMCWRARFSALINPQDYCFAVTEESKPIRCGTATLLGKPFTIPLGTVLFDPSSRDKNTRTSEPAKPLDNSNRSKDDTPE